MWKSSIKLNGRGAGGNWEATCSKPEMNTAKIMAGDCEDCVVSNAKRPHRFADLCFHAARESLNLWGLISNG